MIPGSIIIFTAISLSVIWTLHWVKMEKIKLHYNAVDKQAVPVPHFGVVLDVADWQKLAERLRIANTPFVIEPYTRFAGEIGEQSTMFLLDPSGNALEFKSFANIDNLFAK